MKSLALAIALGCLLQLARAAAQNAAITVASPDAIKVLSLQAGQPRLYDSNPLREIEKVSAKLAGWQFTAIPQRLVISYQIRVNKSGVLYAFGGAARKSQFADRPTREQFLGDDAARWVADENAIVGKNIGVCFRRNVEAGETIALHSFEMELAAESIEAVDRLAASPVPPATGGFKPDVDDKSPTEVLSKQAPNAMEWALAPLNVTVPGDIRQNLILLRDDLLDEAQKKPTVATAAYKFAEELCQGLIAALNERDTARVRAGYTAAQAKANMGEITNQALEARRSSTNWPTYRREKDQREEVRKQKENGAALENQRPILEWADRTAQIRPNLDALYAQFRQAGRRSLAAH